MYGIYVYDPAPGVNVYVNAEYTRLTGFTAGDFPAMGADGFRELFHPEDRDRVQEHLDRVFSQDRRRVQEVEYRFRTAGGDWIWCHSRDSRVQRTGGQGPVLVGSFLDITERKSTEAELKAALQQQSETNALLDAIFASAPVGLAFWDREQRFQRINERLAEMNGLPPSAHIGRRPDELFPGIQDLEAILERWREVIETGEPWLDVEIHGETPASGPSIWNESFYPIRLEGEILGLAGIVEDITEQRRAEEEREQLLSALRETDRRKDEFLAVLGHELRNPLAALRNGLAVLKELAGDDERGRPVREMMGRQLAHLVRLVDDLLDLSRVSRGEIELKSAPVELGEVLDEAVELVRPSIQRRGHRLVLQEFPSPPPVVGDFERLVQVVGNLLANASKFSHEGGEIALSVETRDGGVEVRVRDRGFGVPPEQVETMFEMFTQVPEHRQWTGGGGLGIGLALSRKLTELHGGTLTARSAGLGEGSEFVMRLPLPEGAVEQARPEAPAGVLPVASRRVLLVDDNVDAAEALRMLLEMKGHEVRVVHHGAAALEAFQEEVPEVILLDIGLPRMDGLEVARRIRAMPDGGDVVICAVTGWGQERDQRRSAEAGFDIHLTKPVDLARLEAVLRDA
jgi:PAS domain S-box-containing protein